MNKSTITLIIIVILLVGIIGVMAGYMLNQSQAQPANNTTTVTVQNNTTTPTESVKQETSQNSEWMPKTCQRCGKTFYVPLHGEQLNYCDNCLKEMGYL